MLANNKYPVQLSLTKHNFLTKNDLIIILSSAILENNILICQLLMIHYHCEVGLISKAILNLCQPIEDEHIFHLIKNSHPFGLIDKFKS